MLSTPDGNRIEMLMSKNDLKRGARAAEKLHVPAAHRHILLCCDTKTEGCASKKQMEQSWKYLKRRLKQLKLNGRGGVLRNKCYCLDVCKDGPVAIVFPEGTWYGHCTPEVLEEIIQHHLLNGNVLRQHALAHAPLCGGPLTTAAAEACREEANG